MAISCGHCSGYHDSISDVFRCSGVRPGVTRNAPTGYSGGNKHGRPVPAPKPRFAVGETKKLVGPGVYETPNGVWVVKQNQSKTRCYAKKLVEIRGERINENGDGVQIEFNYDPGAIYNLTEDDRMDVERAKALTIRYGRCIVCGRRLKAKVSVERGIGPICIQYFGAMVGV